MLKWPLEYTNGFGEKVKEDLYFNLSTLEQTRLVAKYAKGEDVDLKTYVEEITRTKNIKAVLALIEDILLTSYGERSADGYRFDKSKAIREKFEYSYAYAQLFEDFMTDENKMKQFVTKVVDKNQQSIVSEPKLTQ